MNQKKGRQLRFVLNKYSVEFFISTSKNFGCLFKTLKGSIYEGCSAWVLAKSRTKTCVQVGKGFGTYVGF